MDENLIQQIQDKYTQLGENPETYLKGLLQAKPINYWDYIEVDTLLSLQKPRTDYKDEGIFIMYHQITELMLKLVVHEIKQITEEPEPDHVFLLNKINRIIRYTEMLVTSFDIMREGMDYDDYRAFRTTLAPASGFQSAQFRFIEIYCTRLENLLNTAGKKRIPDNPSVEDYFEHIYWKDAGHDLKAQTKTLTLQQFEERYLEEFIALAKKVKGNTVEDKVLKLASGPNFDETKPLHVELKEKLREFDYLYNITWPTVHIQTAQHYLDKKGENTAATGGSKWKKYLNPKQQQRKFFPTLWTEAELEAWPPKRE